MKKGFTCRKTGFVWKKWEEKSLLRKEGFRLQKKTGIAKAKKYKNRIYLRKKGNNKNRKKKDFFPPNNTQIILNGLYLTNCIVQTNKFKTFPNNFFEWRIISDRENLVEKEKQNSTIISEKHCHFYDHALNPQ